MKNSEKLKYYMKTVFWICIGLFILWKVPNDFLIFLAEAIVGVLYFIYNLYLYSEFPINVDMNIKRMYRDYIYCDDSKTLQENCQEYFKEEKLGVIAITFWWCRFMYYLDYKLNKTKNEEIK